MSRFFRRRQKRQSMKDEYGPWQKAFTEDALRRAWTAVRANKGRGGSDGETVAQFERHLDLNLRELRAELLDGRYAPRNVTQILVPKPSGGWRPLALWAIRDRVAQRAVYNYLEPGFERRFLPCSFGFRPGLSTKDAAQAVQQAREAGANWVVDADIKDCFGQMESRRVLKQLDRWQVPGAMKELIRRWLQAQVWNAWRGDGQANVSQGGVISPLLCNLYLHPFDQQMQKRGRWLVRYADDFVCLTQDEKEAHDAHKQAAKSLKRVGLQLHTHPQKTRITNFNEGFQFVGWFFIRDEMHRLY